MPEPQSVEEFFESLPSRVKPENVAGLTNSFLFAIEPAGAWHVAVEDGALTVTPGEAEADARITMSEETFQRLLARRQSAAMALLTGKIKVSGDMAAASKLQKLLA
jgi:putative sterol carrier protein